MRLNPTEYDGLIHIGDYAYDIQDDKGMRGDEFFNLMSPLTSRVPYIAIPGNHEKHNKFKLFNYRFKMPGGGKPHKRGSNYFSYNLKGAHFVTVNWDWVFKPKDKQKFKERWNEVFEWLREDLELYSRDNQTHFLIFLSHRPFNCSYDSKDCYIFLHLRPFKALLKKYNVDLILNGHKHKYYRLKKITDDFELGGEEETKFSPLQIINGRAGCKNIDVLYFPNIDGKNKPEIEEDEISRGPLDNVALNDEAYWMELEISPDRIKGQLIASISFTIVDKFEVLRRDLREEPKVERMFGL